MFNGDYTLDKVQLVTTLTVCEFHDFMSLRGI